jgi:hypothetical protein
MRAFWSGMHGAGLVLLGVALCSFASCGSGPKQLPTFEVKGQVLQAGKPVPHATVVFHPTFELGPDVSKPRATTGEDGTFVLSTYGASDGAPEGDYKVTVEQWLTTNPEKGPESKLPWKYAKPELSGLTAKVNSGKNEIPPIQLQ